MKVIETELPGVLVIELQAFRDDRGCFLETWHERRYREAGIPFHPVQDNFSLSGSRVLRGLHFQHPNPQGKLVSVLQGEVFDVAVDVRAGSPTFGRWVGVGLSGDNARQLWIPEGFAHGFAVVSGEAVVSYKCTAFYDRDADSTVLWNDPDLAIDWPFADPITSAKDAAAPRLRDLPPDRLPRWTGEAAIAPQPVR